MSPAGNTTHLQGLLDLAVAGNDDAYAQLLAQANQRLWKLTRKMLRGSPRLRRWEATDDVFQTAALRLYNSLSQVRPASVREFLGLAALQIRRTLIDLARYHYGPERHGARHHSDGDERAVEGGLLRNHHDADDAESLDQWTRFHEAVERLPETDREVFQLVWYGGMSQGDIAELLAVSVPTVQRRWYRAQSILGTMLRGGAQRSEDNRDD